MKSVPGFALSLAVLMSTSTRGLVAAKCHTVCHDDSCGRAVTGTAQGPDFTSQAKMDCSTFIVSTVYGHTTTVTAPTTSSASVPITIPTYASACSNSALYASACSCYGITRHVETLTDETTTVTVPPASSSPEPSSTIEESSTTSEPPASSSTSSSASSTSSAPPEPTGCTGDLLSCGDTCIDVKNDPANCGGCGVVCQSGVCSNGACSLNSCTGQTCDTFTACGPGGSCVCASVTGGTGFCADGQTPCSGLADCDTSADCPRGSVCAVGTCCTRNVCIVADTCGGSTRSAPAMLFRPRGVTWVDASIGHRAGYVGEV